MKKSRQLCEALGRCWHFETYYSCNSITGLLIECSCGDVFYSQEAFDTHCRELNSDYVAHPWLVIREMEKRGCLDQFICYVCSINYSQWNREVTDFTKLVAIDTTGKLARLALDWLQKEGWDGRNVIN